MTYVPRNIKLTFQLGEGSFGGSGFDTLTIQGLRVLAQFQVYLNTVMSVGSATGVIRVWGMTLDQMNQLTVAGLQWQQRNNLVAVQAGDQISGMSTVFNGQISEAYPDFSNMPDVAFTIIGITGREIAMKPVPPTSYPGPVSADTVMQSLAGQAGLGYQSGGVSAQLASPYFQGTLAQQMAACARAANAYACIDGTSNELAMWPKSAARPGDVLLVSPQTGMIGYPSYQQNSVVVRTVYDPGARIGGNMQVKSQLTPASGTWMIVAIEYNLSSQLPDGPWEMTLRGVTPVPGAGPPTQ